MNASKMMTDCSKVQGESVSTICAFVGSKKPVEHPLNTNISCIHIYGCTVFTVPGIVGVERNTTITTLFIAVFLSECHS